jgi:hypothetical protein
VTKFSPYRTNIKSTNYEIQVYGAPLLISTKLAINFRAVNSSILERGGYARLEPSDLGVYSVWRRSAIQSILKGSFLRVERGNLEFLRIVLFTNTLLYWSLKLYFLVNHFNFLKAFVKVSVLRPGKGYSKYEFIVVLI